MKKFTLVLFALIISFGFVLSGCSTSPLTMPQNYIQTSSNGGFVVEVGNFLYFANAYQSYENLNDKADNDGEKVKQYSLKRAQTESNVLQTDENDNIIFENVANKIAGYQTSNMFVVNEYLYFTSPNIHKNDSKDAEEYNTYQFELSTLFRIKLDGTGLKELYTTETSSAKFYLTGGNEKTLLIYDDEKIMQINCYQNSTKLNTLAEKVKSTVFPYNQNQEIVNIYYTTDREEDDLLTGNILKRVNVKTGEATEVAGYQNNAETITLVAYTGNRIFYTRTGVESRKGFYSNDFSQGSSSEQKQRYDTDSFKSTSKVFEITNSQYDVSVFVFEYNNNIYMQNLSDDNDSAYVKLTTTSSKLAFVDQTYVYYTADDGIYRVSVLGDHKVQQVSDLTDFNADLLDFDGRYVYFYAKADGATTETKYLHRADTTACNNDVIKTECIAKLLDEDVKTEETSD